MIGKMNQRQRLIELIAGLPQEVRAHGVRTGLYARIMAHYLPKEEMKKSRLAREDLYAAYQYGGEYHDIGKVLISRYLIGKNEELSEIEEEVFRLHPLRTEEILKEYLEDGTELEEMKNIILDMGRYHHERADGTGYPYGLKGKEIPVCAGICAIADIFEHLVEQREYRKVKGFEELCRQIEEQTELYGAVPMDCFIKAGEGIKTLYLNQRKGRR